MADIPADVLADIAAVQSKADAAAALIRQPPVGVAVQETASALTALEAKWTAQYGNKAAPILSALRNHFATIHYQGPSAGSGPAWEAAKQKLLLEMIKA